MNKIILIGRLTKDIEMRSTATGKRVGSFSIAVDDGKDKDGVKITQFFNCSAWERLAETLEKWSKKGDKIFIVGKLQNKTSTKSDGTKTYYTDILVNEIEFLSSPSKTEDSAPSYNTTPTQAPRQQAVPNDMEMPEITDEDFNNIQMPF